MAEHARLRAMYVTCEYSLERTSDELSNEPRRGDRNAEVAILSGSHNEVIAKNAYSAINRMESQFPKYLRETIFVRLISSIEVFIVDIIREVFVVRPELFHSDARLEISHREALSLRSLADLRTRIISRELRKLQGGGLTEIAKYVERRLGIRFGALVQSMNQFREFHDRRHILVHRLGRADEYYRHAYNYRNKGPLTVTREYLLSAFEVASGFADNLHTTVMNLMHEVVIQRSSDDDHYAIELLIVPLTEDGTAAVLPSYHFSVNHREYGDKVSTLDDILAVSKNEENEVKLVLSGPFEDVKSYLRAVRKLERKGDLAISSKETLRQPNFVHKVKPCKLDRGHMEQIAMSLPKKPWPKGIHKVIASHHGVSNTQCTSAITLILEDEYLSSLIGVNPITTR